MATAPTLQYINIGTKANDGTGETLRSSFDKINKNFTLTHDYMVGANGTVFNGGSILNPLIINDPTDSTSNGSGALQVQGGAYIGQSQVVGTVLYVGPGARDTGFINPTIIGTKSGQTYVQAGLVNNDGRGSSDWIAYGSGGTDTSGWVDMGFTGNLFNDPNYTITEQGEGYIFVSGYADGISHGSLVLCTDDKGLQNDIVFGTGGFHSNNEVMRLSNNNKQLSIYMSTESTNTKTGALVVSGGVGVTGNVHVGGILIENSTQFVANATTLTYNANATDRYIFANNNGQSFINVVLPTTGVKPGKVFTIKKTTGTLTTNVQVSGTTIDGNTNVQLTGYGSLTVVYGPDYIYYVTSTV